MSVYIIRAGESGPVKIGKADDVPERMRELQCGNHEELNLLRVIDGGPEIELRLHFAFKHLRIRGEWFAFDPQMLTISPSSVRRLPPSIDNTDGLLEQIERHLETTGENPTRFGKRAAGDPRLVSGLRQGREPRRATVSKVLAAIESSKAEAAILLDQVMQ